MTQTRFSVKDVNKIIKSVVNGKKNGTSRRVNQRILDLANDPANIFAQGDFKQMPLSNTYELSVDVNYVPISLNRILCTYVYSTHGVIQTAIDQPVEDALRNGIILKCDEFDPDDLHTFEQYVKKELIPVIKQAVIWARLYGGGGILINTGADPAEEFDLDSEVTTDDDLSFKSADRWELLYAFMDKNNPAPFNYYGHMFNKSRVMTVMGKTAPSFLRHRLQGWEMSELERMIRPLNVFCKIENVVYELLDEAKVDIWKIKGFNQQILKKAAQGATIDRIQYATFVKNFMHAITMDKEDDYEQKQITFSGLAEIMVQNRIALASAMKMPITKLFGISASGFNSGEDDIENYNSMVESTIRPQISSILDSLLPICAKKCFDLVPERIEHEFHPLRELSSEAEENVKSSKQNRYGAQYSQGMFRSYEYAEILRKEGLCPIDTEVLDGAEPEIPEGNAFFERPPQDMATKKVPENK